jgi:hypothetical protein
MCHASRARLLPFLSQFLLSSTPRVHWFFLFSDQRRLFSPISQSSSSLQLNSKFARFNCYPVDSISTWNSVMRDWLLLHIRAVPEQVIHELAVSPGLFASAKVHNHSSQFQLWFTSLKHHTDERLFTNLTSNFKDSSHFISTSILVYSPTLSLFHLKSWGIEFSLWLNL